MKLAQCSFRLVSNPDRPTLNRLAEIYNERCYTEDGIVNPYNEDYRNGGGHFSRDADWFAANLGEGSRLIVVTDDKEKKIVGYGLFYVNPATFPEFASEALWPRDLDFIGERLAYTYLFIIDRDYSGKGLGWKLVSAIRDECRKAGAVAMIHEFFVRPVTNLASARIHQEMAHEWGAIDTGRTATHTIVRPTPLDNVKVIYAQWMIPTLADKRFVIDIAGNITEE